MLNRICAMLTDPVTATLVTGCDVDVQVEGELRSVDDVETEAGEMPEIDVGRPDVDVDTDSTEVEVTHVGAALC